jgi:penicillin-binding protein 1C
MRRNRPIPQASGPRSWRSRRWIALAVLVAAGVGFWSLAPRPLFKSPLSAVLEARDGELLSARIAADGQWRFPEMQQVPPRFAQALVRYEDHRFESHPGVDVFALGRAVRDNWRARRVVSGASTLTMQLARLVRSRDGKAPRRNLWSKGVEALLALRLEAGYSKQELLALYAGHAPFGGNVVGLEAAAWRYFGRPPDQLSWAECATLAVLPNSPSLVNPGRNREALRQKRDRLLRVLAREGRMAEVDLQLALAEPLVQAPLALPDDAPHLLDTLRARHPRQFRFHSTLDATLQRQAVQLTRERGEELDANGIGNVAALVVDNRSFEVLAYVGNAAWQSSGRRSLAVDIVQRPRSTGSILKPFLYAAMLDSGQLLPRMLVPDIPTQFRGFAPENFDRQFRGAVPADEALAQSLNVPAVRLLRDYGYARFYDLLQALQFSTLTQPPDHYGLSLILGGAEATLWDVTQAYANLADRARLRQEAGPPPAPHPLVWLREAEAAQGPKVAARPVPLSIGAAWLTQSALLEVKRPDEEANWKQFASSRRIAWKTGTSWGLRDGWAVGSTTRFTVGVWAGNASGTGVPGLTGSLAAAPLLFALHNRLPAADWYVEPAPALRRVSVCADDGFLASDLCTAVDALVPVQSHFDRQTPYHRAVHLDATGRFRVDAGCERVSAMRHAAWLVLPPAMEHFYRARRSDYRPLPPLRPGCRGEDAADGRGTLEFIYPGPGGKIYVPVDLDNRKGHAVFEAVHRDPAATLFWHLDDEFAGQTSHVHQLTVDIAPGMHVVTVVDGAGRRLTRGFEVLARGGGYTAPK